MNKKEKLNLFALLLNIRSSLIIITIMIPILFSFYLYIVNTDRIAAIIEILFLMLISGIISGNIYKKDKETLNKLENIITENERSFTMCPFDSTPNKKA